MSKKRHIILIPVYNDEKSLNKLLKNIDGHIETLVGFETEILILDDKSAEKINLESSRFKNLKKIAILRVKENIGSQKVIAIGLNYLRNIKENFYSFCESISNNGISYWDHDCRFNFDSSKINCK